DAAERARRPEHAAVARLRAARLLRRSGHGAEARVLLEAAHGLGLKPIDTRSLIERALAHELLVDEPRAPARAAELALDAARSAPAGDEKDAFDPRTPCELADAWLLAARAYGQLDDAKRMREALEAARKLEPRDRRELDDLAARLRTIESRSR